MTVHPFDKFICESIVTEGLTLLVPDQLKEKVICQLVKEGWRIEWSRPGPTIILCRKHIRMALKQQLIHVERKEEACSPST